MTMFKTSLCLLHVIMYLPFSGSGFAQEKPTPVKDIKQENCRQIQRPIELSSKYLYKFLAYYNEKIISQQLLISQVLCDLGDGERYNPIGVKGNKATFHIVVEQNETVIRYGEYLTGEPASELAVFFITKPNGVVRAMLRLNPDKGEIWSVAKNKDLLDFSITDGIYTAPSESKFTTDVTTRHYSLSQ